MPFLDWVNKNQAKESTRNVPIYLLKHEKFYGEQKTKNLLIHGDNLLALKALVPLYAGQVKCIFIDPPYNTQSAFEHYDDKLEHSQWLSMMYPRLKLLHQLIADDGSMWVTVDDNESHYLRVLLDEIFGRKNFVANVIWQKRTSPDARIELGAAHDHILVYAKNSALISFNKMGLTEQQKSKYKNPDNDPNGPWVSTDFTAQGWRPNQMYSITTPSGQNYDPPPGRCWANVEPVFNSLVEKNKIWFGKNGDSRPRIKNYLNDAQGASSWTWWPNSEVGHNQEAKKEVNKLFGADSTFITPKPERLISRILSIASIDGELILDSFLGSGTTAAVAHKMGRRYIGIEMGEHARTHCVPRLDKVIDGEQGGISEAVGWKGGGGFQFCTLGEAAFDDDGRINPEIKFPTLAAFIWHFETATAAPRILKSPFLGVHDGVAYFLLYNGILGDKRPDTGNVLTHAVLETLKDKYPHDGPRVIYGEMTRIGEARLNAEDIEFKQIPYDVKTR